MLRFPWTTSTVDSDKLLLRKCHDGDAVALEKFTGRSYLNEIVKTVRMELQEDYDSTKVDLIAKLCVVHIYRQWEDLPSPISDLRIQIRKAAKAFAVQWRRRDLA